MFSFSCFEYHRHEGNLSQYISHLYGPFLKCSPVGTFPDRFSSLGEFLSAKQESCGYQRAHTSDGEGSILLFLTTSLNWLYTEHAQWHHPILTARIKSIEVSEPKKRGRMCSAVTLTVTSNETDECNICFCMLSPQQMFRVLDLSYEDS